MIAPAGTTPTAPTSGYFDIQGDNGQSVAVFFADDENGTNASQTRGANQDFVAFVTFTPPADPVAPTTGYINAAGALSTAERTRLNEMTVQNIEAGTTTAAGQTTYTATIRAQDADTTTTVAWTTGGGTTPHPTPENLTIAANPTRITEDSAQTTVTITLTETGTSPNISAAAVTATRDGITFGAPSGLGTGTVTIVATVPASALTTAGIIRFNALVTGEGSGQSYINERRSVDVRVSADWFTQLATTAPTATSTGTNQGDFVNGDTASINVTDFANQRLYAWVPTSQANNVSFRPRGSAFNYVITVSSVTDGDHTRIDFDAFGNNATRVVEVVL